MDGKTINEHGFIVIGAIVIAIIMMLATPFGQTTINGITSLFIAAEDVAEKKLSDEELKKHEDELYEMFDTSDLLQPGVYNPKSVVCNKFAFQMVNEDCIRIDRDGVVTGGDNMRNINGDYIMQHEIVKIDEFAFANCDGMTMVRLSDNTTIVKQSAFKSCDNLRAVITNEGLEKIEEFAFSDCASLTMVHINKGIQNIGAGAFTQCPNLKIIKFIGTVEEWNAVTKAPNWCDNEVTKIICTDGTVSMSGK